MRDSKIIITNHLDVIKKSFDKIIQDIHKQESSCGENIAENERHVRGILSVFSTGDLNIRRELINSHVFSSNKREALLYRIRYCIDEIIKISLSGDIAKRRDKVKEEMEELYKAVEEYKSCSVAHQASPPAEMVATGGRTANTASSSGTSYFKRVWNACKDFFTVIRLRVVAFVNYLSMKLTPNRQGISVKKRYSSDSYCSKTFQGTSNVTAKKIDSTDCAKKPIMTLK